MQKGKKSCFLLQNMKIYDRLCKSQLLITNEETLPTIVSNYVSRSDYKRVLKEFISTFLMALV